MLPDFLIVGTMKSGTTTLVHYLRLHPDVFMPEDEVHFFNNRKNFNRGIGWYEKFFEDAGDVKAVGEKTPTYSYAPGVPGRIREVLPEAKLIWVFRDPVKRAYSNYWHAVKRGAERLEFSAAIKREDERIKKSMWLGYRKRSIYSEQVKRFLEYFDKSQMMFVLFEKLVSDPEETVSRTFDFLGVRNPVDLPPAGIRKNVTNLPGSVTLQWLARRVFGNSFLYKLVEKANIKKVPGYPEMDEDLKSSLSRYFQPYNEELAEITGLDTSIWDSGRNS